MLKIQVRNNERIKNIPIIYMEYSMICLEYSSYVIASFKYLFNAHVHTKYSEVCSLRVDIIGKTYMTI